MLPNDRLAYSPIRNVLPSYCLSTRLAVWVIVKVEEWDIRLPMPRTVMTPPANTKSAWQVCPSTQYGLARFNGAVEIATSGVRDRY